MRRDAQQSYLIALGSNRRHVLYGAPRQVLGAAMEELSSLGTVGARSPIIATEPMGPAQRRFANAAALIESELDPEAMLAGLKRMESEFGRRSGLRWGDRVLDLDIILWSEGEWRSPALQIPHAEFRQRSFVLDTVRTLAPNWRDPKSGLSIAQLHGRLTKPRPAPR